MNRLQNYLNVIEKRGLKDLPYQKDFIINNESFTKPFVLGAGTSAGKTIINIIWLELFYKNPNNSKLKTLILPASTVVLRDNFYQSLIEFNPSFTYCVCENGNDLKQAIKSNCNVVIVLPQTAINSINYLTKFHNFILDEAHQWYFQKTISNIVKKTKPQNQILLTGTPSRFIAKSNQFDFQFVPVMELYELGKVSNVKIEVVSSVYDFKYDDYNGSYGNLKSKSNTHKDAEESFRMVCREMIKKLKNPIKGYQSFNNFTSNKIGDLFNFLEKTIIFCHSRKQADKFYKFLSKTKGLEGKVLVSHYESDKDSVQFNNFKNQPNYKILIAVDRGKLGFSMGNLFNIVDFTLTQNLDMLLQMYGRLLRLSDSKKQKIFYKVATKNTAPYFVDIMTAMLCLTKYEWYSKYNGKNMGGILIPKVSISKTNPKTKIKGNINIKKNSKLLSLEQLGIPLDLNLFKTNIQHTQDGKFVTVAETTLDDVRKQFYNIGQHLWSEEEILKLAKKCKTLKEFREKYKDAFQAATRKGGEFYNNIKNMLETITYWNFEKCKNVALQYKKFSDFSKNEASCVGHARENGFLDEITSHMIKKNNKPMTLEEFNKIVKENNLITKQDLRTYKGSNLRTVAYRLGIWDTFPNSKKGIRTLSQSEINEVKKVALKYKRRTDFKIGNPRLYQKARFYNIIDDVCKHMISNKKSWLIGRGLIQK
jgi:superfamily II DNA or RNA helicase